ncbi:GNAT family N-acetyltransferase [Tardiphaga sp. 813_E8_N1_3]|uniref:GNAT family N-acetyltransferase n=1 Tax=Tardiphaga sp. 813_E8_N1_3 TaxID=3240760 RepID=UPI003F212B26
MTNAPTITVPDAPGEAERLVVANALLAYNTKTVGPNNHQPLSILIHDPATGEPIGGIWGKTAFNWCFVELFVVPEQFRGQDIGSKVLAKAEEIARERGCIGLWLDTYWFQARSFYEKQGYEVFGEIPDYPRGGPRYFLKKSFV